jgi:hypothetical protein
LFNHNFTYEEDFMKARSAFKSLVLVLVLSLAVAACGDSSTNTKATSAVTDAPAVSDAPEIEDIVLAEINHGLSSPFGMAIHEGILSQAAELGTHQLTLDTY